MCVHIINAALAMGAHSLKTCRLSECRGQLSLVRMFELCFTMERVCGTHGGLKDIAEGLNTAGV